MYSFLFIEKYIEQNKSVKINVIGGLMISALLITSNLLFDKLIYYFTELENHKYSDEFE